MVITKDGTTITQTGNCVYCSDGKTYTLANNLLIGPQGIVSMNVSSIAEAVGIVAGLHGGRKC